MSSEAEEFLGIKGEDGTKPIESKSPIFGVASIIVPIAGVPFAFMIASDHKGEGEGWGAFVILFGILFLSLLIGGISAIIGLIRSEKFIFLSLIGLFISLLPILWLLSH